MTAHAPTRPTRAVPAQRGAPVRRRHEFGRRHAGLGMRRISIGLILLLAFITMTGVVEALVQAPTTPRPMLLYAAWGILVLADLAVVTITKALGEHLPAWAFGLFLTALGVLIALDFAAQWGEAGIVDRLSAGSVAATSIVLACTTRRVIEIVLASVALTLLVAILLALHGDFRGPELHDEVFMLAQVLLPGIVGASVIGAFRRMIRIELERALSQSALAAPELTVGSLASERLARLDLAAENLLADVADGRIELPLPPEDAARAGALATELRFNLLKSRNQTWLDLALEESELLSHAVRVEDASRAAGLLATRQRAALLSAIWLIHESIAPARAGAIVVRFLRTRRVVDSTLLLELPIRLSVPASSRTAIDPAVWEHLTVVGRYREHSESERFHVDIRCIVRAGRTGPSTPDRGTTVGGPD